MSIEKPYVMSGIADELALHTEELPQVVAIGAAVNLDCRNFSKLTIIADAAVSTSITVSRVDSLAAGAHGSNSQTVAAGALLTLDVDWAFYRVSAAVGPARVCRA